jgi:hypothetical protein
MISWLPYAVAAGAATIILVAALPLLDLVHSDRPSLVGLSRAHFSPNIVRLTITALAVLAPIGSILVQQIQPILRDCSAV